MNKQMETFLFNPPINLVEEGNWLLAVSWFECTNSVSNIIDENNSFSILIPGQCRVPSYFKYNNFDDLKNLVKLRSENDIDLHVEEVRKRGN